MTVKPAQFPLGIRVSTGVGLPFGWTVFGLLLVSFISHTVKFASLSHPMLRLPSPDLLFTLLLQPNGLVTPR